MPLMDIVVGSTLMVFEVILRPAISGVLPVSMAISIGGNGP